LALASVIFPLFDALPTKRSARKNYAGRGFASPGVTILGGLVRDRISCEPITSREMRQRQ